MWQECPPATAVWYAGLRGKHHTSCRCGGTGRVPTKPDLAVLLTASPPDVQGEIIEFLLYHNYDSPEGFLEAAITAAGKTLEEVKHEA